MGASAALKKVRIPVGCIPRKCFQVLLFHDDHVCQQVAAGYTDFWIEMVRDIELESLPAAMGQPAIAEGRHIKAAVEKELISQVPWRTWIREWLEKAWDVPAKSKKQQENRDKNPDKVEHRPAYKALWNQCSGMNPFSRPPVLTC